MTKGTPWSLTDRGVFMQGVSCVLVSLLFPEGGFHDTGETPSTCGRLSLR